MTKVAEILQVDETVEPDSAEFPGLASLVDCLVEDYLGHKDKEVRLCAVLCCMELFGVVSSLPASAMCDFGQSEVLTRQN